MQSRPNPRRRLVLAHPECAAGYFDLEANSPRGKGTNAGERGFRIDRRGVARALGVLVVGGIHPDRRANAKGADRLNGIPTNHNPRFAPVVHPALQTGVEALIVTACAWLAP